MVYTERFKVQERPWEIADRLDRMRYLISHLVWKGTIWQAYVDDVWLVSNGNNGYKIIPLWPTKESGRLSLKSSESLSFKRLSLTSFDDEFLSKMYDDELIAAFPNPVQEYEMLTIGEFRKAFRYAKLLKLVYEGKLTSEEAHELEQYITLKRKSC